MSRKRKMMIGAVNIVSHPHGISGYIDLFRRALKVPIGMGGDQRAMLGTCAPIGTDPKDGLQGSIFRYTELDMDGQWLDTITGKEMDPDEVHRLVRVPDGLKPNYSIIWYNFFPKSHKLVFELERNDPVTKKKTTFSASSAVKFFSELLSKTAPSGSTIEVTAVQSRVTLRRIFGLRSLTKLEIMVNRPNPTDGTFEEEIKRQLEEERASRLFQELTSRDSEGLNPSERTRALAKVALDNGYVDAKGENAEGEKVHINTKNVPIESLKYYDPKEGFAQVFTRSAEQLITSLKEE